MNISIVIPVYNAEKFLSETLSSVKAQTIQPYEIVIVNDASTDRTRFIAEKYSSVIINHDQNEGIGASRQHGAEAASGDFIAFLSGDDVYYPHFLESCLPYFEEKGCSHIHGLLQVVLH